MISLVLDNNDSVVNTYLYDPYGVTEHQTGSQYNPYQFAGGYFDSFTLYYKYGTRYYDRFGRWTQKDPVPSANPYVYANDDPVNLVDPSGRSTGPSQSCIVSFLFNFIVGIATSIGAVASAALADAAASAASDAAITFAAGASTFATLATATTIVAVTLAYGFYLAITNCSA